MVRQITLALCLCLLWISNASALSLISGLDTDENASFKWKDVQWTIPKRLLLYFPVSLSRNDEINLNAAYRASDSKLVSYHEPHDVALGIRIRQDDSEDPKREIDSFKNLRLAFFNEPSLQSTHLTGLTYLGSQSSIHFFRLEDRNTYIQCHTLFDNTSHMAKLETNVSSQLFYCKAIVALPSGLFSWVDAPSIRLDQLAPVLRASYLNVLSFMH